MFEKKQLRKQLETIEIDLKDQSNWKDFEKTNRDLKKKNYLTNFLDNIDDLDQSYKDTIELIEITDDSSNPDLINDLEDELDLLLKKISLLQLCLLEEKMICRSV